MIIPEYWNLPKNFQEWNDEDNEVYKNSLKTYRDLRIKLANEFPDIYSQVIKRFNRIQNLSQDNDLSVILAISNKLSWEGKHLKIIIVTQFAEILDPQIIGFYYNGIERFII